MLPSAEQLSEREINGRPVVVQPHAEPAKGREAFFARIPVLVWGIALLAALLHIAPLWRAQLQTPPGWAFSGILNASPDFMQYRIFMHQTPALLLENKFTVEPNSPHIPAVYYSAMAAIGRRLNQPPEFVFEYAGCVWAFALVVLLFATVRHFSSSARQTWWVFCICLVGGGLGAHVLLLESILKPANAMKRLFASPETSPTWVFYEQCRGAYLFQTLFDAHFVFIWFLALAAVVSFYFALRQPSAWRTALAALLFAAITLVHIHEAVLLTLIAASVLVLLWRKGLLTPGVLVSSFCCLVPAWAMLALLLHIYSSSGLPVPDYRMYNMAIAILFVAYPLGWVLLAWGLSRYWERAGFLECFLLGWLLACTGMTLSGPFYTFGDRGLMTLLVPLYLIAGSIYFSHFRTVTPLAAALAVFVLALTPLREVRVQWRQSGFDPSASYRFLSPDHQAILVTLRHAADAKDVLLAHEDELRWLAPEYPGKTYYAHFFMTVNYWQKRSNVDRFFSAGAAEQDAFLRKEGIRFVYVEPGRNSASLADVHNLVPLIRNSAGTLFQYTGGDRQPQANSSAVDARREPT